MTDEAKHGTPVSVHISASSYEALTRRAEREGRSVDQLLVDALDEWLTWRATPSVG